MPKFDTAKVRLQCSRQSTSLQYRRLPMYSHVLFLRHILAEHGLGMG